MIIRCEDGITPETLASIKAALENLKLKTTEVRTQSSHYLIALGKQEFDIRLVGHLEGVKDVHRVSDAYKLVSRKWRVTPTVIDLDDGVRVGEGTFSLMLGPCSIESSDQTKQIASFLSNQGVSIVRGGAFKPRTSPYSFRGMGIEGLRILKEAAAPFKIKIISEVLEPSQIQEMYDYVDIYQVGTRNNQNFNLLHELGRVDKPVLIKRGMSGSLEELLQSAEYVYANGNERIILCERGIRTFEKAYRNTLDMNAIPVLKEKTHLPVVVDPSHGIGIRRFVEPVSLAAILAGADGLLVEIHPQPEKAASDADQTLSFVEAERLISRARRVFALKEEF